jgi:UDP:flavonoid glycosyltransferase YjiC (YdhE family)
MLRAMSSLDRAGVFVFGSPVAVGHVHPLMPLAKRLVERGHTVVWAISGDQNEPASAWRKSITELGAEFVDLDEHVDFSRGRSEAFSKPTPANIFGRIMARANDVSETAAVVLRAVIGERSVLGGVYDYFAVWSYVAMRRLGIVDIDVVVSAFPAILDGTMNQSATNDAAYQHEFGRLRSSGHGCFDELPRAGLIPSDPAVRVLSFTSPRLCPNAPPYVRLLGVQHAALPKRSDASSIPDAHRELAARLRGIRERGAPVFLMSMGTVVTRMFSRLGANHTAFLKRLYTTLAASAVRSGAFVVASTCDSSAADLGVDETALGPIARERVCAMPFVPQPFLFAEGLVDVMLMHGGANTFHETIVSGVPLLISPGFGDQESVAKAAMKLGVGVPVESVTIPTMDGALSIERVASDVLPAMLAGGVTRWKAAAADLATHVRREDGLAAAEALLLARAK